MTSIAVGFVHPANTVAPQFRRCLTQLELRDAYQQRRIVNEYDQESSANISAARNRIVRAFLGDPARPEWLWMVDTDMTFGDDIVDQLLEVADPKERPIVAGLCFGVRPATLGGVEQFNPVLAAPLVLFPTIYSLDEQGKMQHWRNYPVDEVFQIHSTGAACLLVHRDVVADPRWVEDGHPFPWFRETVLNGEACSEDHFFCLKAGKLGFPIFLNGRAKTGHVKTFVADEDMFLAQWFAEQAARPEPADESVAVLIPVLTRPDNVAPLVESLRANSRDMAFPYFVVDEDDVEETTAVLMSGAIALCYKGNRPGTFAEKINHGYRNTTEPWLFVCGDDVRFHPGWLDEAETLAKRTGAQVVGTNDLFRNSPHHSPHLLIHRTYVDEIGASWDGAGVVCHEGYRHWFVDNEICVAAQQRNVWAKADRAVVEHVHYRNGKAAHDKVYEQGDRFADMDERVWRARFAEHCETA